MNTRAAAYAALLTLAALTGCSSGSDTAADPQACKTAMAKRLEQGLSARANSSPMPTGRPAACSGIDDATFLRITSEVTTEWMDSDQADKVAEDALKSATPVPVPTGLEISAE
ncbi:hypothetical protein [Streptomyces sp. NPDC048256]|uniref:hypothetical protein n=1 Tax=unclassified Streptomyces TaxID=2593676 RepID=UPI0033EA3A92